MFKMLNGLIYVKTNSIQFDIIAPVNITARYQLKGTETSKSETNEAAAIKYTAIVMAFIIWPLLK